MANSLIIAFVIFIALLFLLFLIKKNRKDRKAFQQQLQNDYKKHKEEENDIDIEEKLH